MPQKSYQRCIASPRIARALCAPLSTHPLSALMKEPGPLGRLTNT